VDFHAIETGREGVVRGAGIQRYHVGNLEWFIVVPRKPGKGGAPA